MPPETHAVVLRADGSVVLPDLADGLAPLAAALGGAAEPCEGLLDGPRLAATKRLLLPLPAPPTELSETALWRWHARGAARYRRGETGGCGVSWLEVKLALAQRLLTGCRLCARGCQVDRRRGERGCCGLGAGLRLTTPFRIWGEEPELGRPGLALAAVGCGLRCRFCYRPGNLNAAAGNEADPVALARGIDAAADCRHVHWLGGDPDESLPGILTVHRLVRIDRPLVWNTHSYLTPAQARLLEGVVDGFVADLKFGPGACGERLAGIKGYWPAATATLGRLAAFNSRLLLRHVLLPGHLECCARPVVDWLLQQPWLAAAAARVLVQYEPLGARGELGRHLSAEEEAAASLLNARLAERTGW